MADFIENALQFHNLMISPFFWRSHLDGMFRFGQLFSVEYQAHFLHFLDDLSPVPVLIDQVGQDSVDQVPLWKRGKKKNNKSNLPQM